MMNFLPQGYSFESYSNPYQSQFISPYYGSGAYGWQYSPMARTAPRLPTCQPGTCPPWLPPGIVATPSSGVQELSVLFDPSLAARMATAYNPWSVPRWGKPDNPAWLWPSGAAPTVVPPNVLRDVIPVPLPPGRRPPGGGPGREPVPAPASPTVTTAPTAPRPTIFIPATTPGTSAPTPNPGRMSNPRTSRTTLGRVGRAESRRLSRVRRSAKRRRVPEADWIAVPGAPRGWCGPGEHLCMKKTPKGKSNFCCCDVKGNCVGGRIVLA